MIGRFEEAVRGNHQPDRDDLMTPLSLSKTKLEKDEHFGVSGRYNSVSIYATTNTR